MQTILVASEATWIRDQIQTAFVEPGQRVVEVMRGQDVRDAVNEYEPEIVILDMQIGNMGGIAVALDMRLEQGEGRMPDTPILLLLDREADRFLAKRADVDAAVMKPIDAGRLRRAVKDVLRAFASVASEPDPGDTGEAVETVERAGDESPEPVDLAPGT